MTNLMVAVGPATATNHGPTGGRESHVEDFVVDITFAFAPLPRGSAARLRAVVVPGREQDRIVAYDCLTITTMLAAATELEAVSRVHDAVRGQLGDLAALITGAEVTSAALGELLALMDVDPWEEEAVEVDVPLLLERHQRSRPAWAYQEFLAADRVRMATSARGA